MKESTQFINLLATLVRLYDLYDLDRTPHHSGQASAPLDARRKKADGLWVEIAAIILRFLALRDEKSPDNYVSGEEIVLEVEEGHDVSREDVFTVLKYLHIPCELKFPTMKPSSVLEQTALVEQAVVGNSFRITTSGRKLFAHVHHAQRLDYIPEIVAMLRKDILQGKYDEFSQNCAQIVHIISERSRTVTKVRERNVAFEQYRASILEEVEGHKELLEDVNQSLKALTELFLSQKVVSAVEAYEAEFDLHYSLLAILKNDLRRVDQATGALLRNLAPLCGDFHVQQGRTGAAFDLKNIVDAFWSGEVPVKEIIHKMGVHGVWAPQKMHCSIFDVPRQLAHPLPVQADDEIIEAVNYEELGESLYAFLRAHKDTVREHLKKGPLPMSTLIEEGLDITTIEDAAGLLGICLNLEWLNSGRSGRALITKIQNSCCSIQFESGEHFSITDLQLELVDGDKR